MGERVVELIDEIDAALRAEGTPERAAGQAAYLKSALEHYGTSVPDTRTAVKRLLRQHGDLGHDELLAIAVGLWEQPVHERRVAAIELLHARVDLLGPADVGLIERFVREADTWALVDPLAIYVMGTLAERHDELGAALDRWAADHDFWIRRSALLTLLVPLREGGGDWDRFCTYADAMLDEREFFIRKAIGWVLRDTAKRRPDLVFEWLLPRAERASGVTMREALKPLSESQRTAITAHTPERDARQ